MISPHPVLSFFCFWGIKTSTAVKNIFLWLQDWASFSFQQIIRIGIETSYIHIGKYRKRWGRAFCSWLQEQPPLAMRLRFKLSWQGNLNDQWWTVRKMDTSSRLNKSNWFCKGNRKKEKNIFVFRNRINCISVCFSFL